MTFLPLPRSTSDSDIDELMQQYIRKHHLSFRFDMLANDEFGRWFECDLCSAGVCLTTGTGGGRQASQIDALFKYLQPRMAPAPCVEKDDKYNAIYALYRYYCERKFRTDERRKQDNKNAEYTD